MLFRMTSLIESFTAISSCSPFSYNKHFLVHRPLSQTKKMIRAVALLAALCCAASREVAIGDMVFESDAHTLSGWRGNLWPGTVIPYTIDSSLDADDARILAAIGIIEEKTCIRFREATRSDVNFMKFVYFAGGCRANIGMRIGTPTMIWLKETCSTGSTIHEVLHAMGFWHEQNRSDRDAFVEINTENIQDSYADQFTLRSDINNVGPYDYDSIMHYGATAFSDNGRPTISSPRPIGQRSTLSEGDIRAIEFLYQCIPLPAPKCILTKTGTINIPHSTEFTVSAIATYTTDLISEGVRRRSPFYRTESLTPSPSDAGTSRTISFSFAGTDGTSTTCSVQVNVLGATTVCYGQADPEACSGDRGTCVSNGVCRCVGEYGGPTCAAWATCPYTASSDFDEDDESSLLSTNPADGTGIVTTDSYSGVGSLQVGSAAQVGAKSSTLDFAGHPRRLSARFKYAKKHSDIAFGLYMWKNGIICYNFQPGRLQYTHSGSEFSRRLSVGYGSRSDYLVNPFKWHKVELEVVSATEINEYLDGVLLRTRAYRSTSCNDGISTVGAIFSSGGPSFVDDFKVVCGEFVSITGTLVTAADQRQALRTGGHTIVLRLQSDTWKSDSRSIKRVLRSLSGLRSDSPWNTNMDTLLQVGNVAVSGSLMTITLAALPSYDFQLDEIVTFRVPASSLTEGSEVVDSSSFQIRGWCSGTRKFLDTTGFFLRNAKTPYVPDYVRFEIPAGSSSFSWSVADYKTIDFTSRNVCMSGSCTGSGPALPSSAEISIVLEFTRSSSGVISSIAVAADGASVGSVAWSGRAPGRSSTVYIGTSVETTQIFWCPNVDPEVMHETITAASGKFTLIPGSVEFDVSDEVAIATDASCSSKVVHHARPSNGIIELHYQNRPAGVSYFLCWKSGLVSSAFTSQEFGAANPPPTPQQPAPPTPQQPAPPTPPQTTPGNQGARFTADGCSRNAKAILTTESLIGTVRCCSLDGSSCASMTNSNECFGVDKSFDEAVNICEANGKRLCNGRELETGVCCGSGCGYDQNAVWISPEARYTADGCPGVGSAIATEVSTTGAVRCCSLDGQSCTSLTGSACFGDSRTYDEAMQICMDAGSRLCSSRELSSGTCCSTGCNYDRKNVWISDGSSNPIMAPPPAPLPVTHYAVTACRFAYSVFEATDGHIRCCALDGSSCVSSSSKECLGSGSYDEAAAKCSSIGRRLCSGTEVQGICCNTGCRYNRENIWAIDE